jgi:hypothetical protein
LIVYSGLVPMSPNTTPMAPSMSAPKPVLPWRDRAPLECSIATLIGNLRKPGASVPAQRINAEAMAGRMRVNSP